eukprot:CAMPEP_0181097866 /NCGR_PEP_ID=MMETSP1071-20121207/11801_1 /TAXON_ID=35127 /ORGANISM="Thalassiosira sp., Strain NH16" /LENGTH=591 /DNA_ID=CAMNT_0023180383 /DNA_START=198 /DNA_END=1973 /DNA_ORIENTATION=-
MMKKNRIVTRVKDKTGIARSKNRSDDLSDLRTKYTQFSKNLKFLITTLTNEHAAMAAYSKSRLEVAKAVNSLTVDTPLFKCAGDIPATAVGTTDGGVGSVGGDSATATSVVPYDANPSSYAAIHLQLHKKHKMYATKHKEHILDYATEWERILSTRIVGHLKQSEKLRVDLDHYGKKVEDMHKTMNKTMSKGKSVDDKGVDRLKRNEQKLVQARQEYDRFVNDLCGFMEEVMDRGWKDLHPLLVKMAQFDSTLSNEEASLLGGSMKGVAEQMKGMAAKHPNLRPQGRLNELKTWSLESLSKVNPSMRSDSPLMIAQGGGENAEYMTGLQSNNGVPGPGIHGSLVGGAAADEVHVGGGGLFGQQQQMDRTSSFASSVGSEGFGVGGQTRSRTNTGDSGGGYDWASGGAPAAMSPPGPAGGRGSDMYRSSSYRTAPSSGGLPPLNPQQHAGSFTSPPQRAGSAHELSATSAMLSTMQTAAPPPSMDDVFGASSGMALPPAGMPPPPPSMPPPPPPQSMAPSLDVSALSLYGGQQQGGYALSPSAHSTHSKGSTNPFDGSVGPGTPSHGNPYGNPTMPTHSNPYGGAAPTNPFG